MSDVRDSEAGAEQAEEQPTGRGSSTTRRKLLGTAAAAAPVVLPLTRAGAALPDAITGGSRRKRSVKGMNVVIFISDQERETQHFPPGWARRNLPGLRRLQKNGVTFDRAFTAACMCSPSRASLLTGYFPAQHGVKYTLEENMPDDQYPQVEMPLDFTNLATVMSAAGYNVVYKGKFHCTKPANGTSFVPEDCDQYGFSRWNPPDAGANQDIPEEGGGFYNNDGRFLNDDGPNEAGEEGAIEYIRKHADDDQPFCLIVSLVNPHDVLMYPSKPVKAGYGWPKKSKWFKGKIGLPATWDENLKTKPRVQREFVRLFNAGAGSFANRKQRKRYTNFYGNLIKKADDNLREVLGALDEHGLTDDTLIIRTSDHGEMGLAHGGMRQKNFNFYEETLRVPLIFSNPKLFRRRFRCKHLVSHVDFLPTMASLFGAPKSARSNWQGKDYSRSVLDPRNAKPVQDYVVFTYDDYLGGQPTNIYPRGANHIISIREKRWKLAKYYNLDDRVEPVYEMYDLKHDPLEKRNIAYSRNKKTRAQRRHFRRLKRKLDRVEQRRLQPLPNTPQPETPPSLA